ncbi:hypothetical protein PSPO01_12228 [Paraphaeosphaeria sporulosa]
MNSASCIFLAVPAFVDITAATPSLNIVYQIRLSSSNSAHRQLHRHRQMNLYKVLCELPGTVHKTHLILTGNIVALGLYDVPDADPTPGNDGLAVAKKYSVW